MRLFKNKKPYKVLMLLYKEGPKYHHEIAKHLKIKEVIRPLNYEDLKNRYRAKEIKYPPRHTLRIYPGVSTLLNNLKKPKDGSPALIQNLEGRWVLTDFGKKTVEEILQKEKSY